ncbi:hypothetical protein EVA_05091 [gut metagenome]|uniref:Uncharacterized protein n=1 Tax=gut metagenome TaxID=749906 RepID=J9GV91_9ZZZZ
MFHVRDVHAQRSLLRTVPSKEGQPVSNRKKESISVISFL